MVSDGRGDRCIGLSKSWAVSNYTILSSVQNVLFVNMSSWTVGLEVRNALKQSTSGSFIFEVSVKLQSQI